MAGGQARASHTTTLHLPRFTLHSLVDESFCLLTAALEGARLRLVDGRHRHPRLLGRLCATDAAEGQAPEGLDQARLELLVYQDHQAVKHAPSVLLIPAPIQLGVTAGTPGKLTQPRIEGPCRSVRSFQALLSPIYARNRRLGHVASRAPCYRRRTGPSGFFLFF